MAFAPIREVRTGEREMDPDDHVIMAIDSRFTQKALQRGKRVAHGWRPIFVHLSVPRSRLLAG